MHQQTISARGVRVHNLKDVDLDLPRGELIVFCGVSGSGKTSMALDTLFAEGQRRYIESFSAYTRQFLARLDKPDAESIEGLPPSVAVVRANPPTSNRSTVATATETADYLRLLWSHLAELHCFRCGAVVHHYSPQSAAAALSQLPRRRLMVGFAVRWHDAADGAAELGSLQQQGYVRVVIGDRMHNVDGEQRNELQAALKDEPDGAIAIVDRLSTDGDPERLAEAFESSMEAGDDAAHVFIEATEEHADALAERLQQRPIAERNIDGRRFWEFSFSRNRICDQCQTEYPDPEPRLFSFNHPHGACRECEGFGDTYDIDMQKVVPDPSLSLREGAIAPWNTKSYRHELKELLALADDYDIPVDVPFEKLSKRARTLLHEGVPERKFGGLSGFFRWLERKKYKLHVRVFLSRLRSYRPCPACQSQRLRPESLSYHIDGRSIADIYQMQADEAAAFLQSLTLDDHQRAVGGELVEQVVARLEYLKQVGLGYLQLGRPLRTVSGGEMQRVSLTSTLGSTLVNMLYVLDEPTAGLHPQDTVGLVKAITQLRDRGNSVVVVEHNPLLIEAADHLVEFGPGAGAEGGSIVFQGTRSEMLDSDTLTGQFLSRDQPVNARTPRSPDGWLKLTGARGHNLQKVTAEFPLGLLCLVTGVSGSGKSSLIQETLYGAIAQKNGKENVKTLPFTRISGIGQIDDCILVDQQPVSRSLRSNPATYLKLFDDIRSLFAATVEARTRNFTAGHFSFNSDKGRCDACQGNGEIEIDMQFLADVHMRCDVCKGSRYRSEILDIHYRGKTIADVLGMTVGEAYPFFRGQAKLQAKLKRLIDVGLGYVQLGQSTSTLSSGESQRLKLASFLASSRAPKTLFIMDEPTVGLHPADITKLIACFDALIAAGHSLVVVDHNRQLIEAADWLIDLGPGAAQNGGQIVATGTPEELRTDATSPTGRALATS